MLKVLIRKKYAVKDVFLSFFFHHSLFPTTIKNEFSTLELLPCAAEQLAVF